MTFTASSLCTFIRWSKYGGETSGKSEMMLSYTARRCEPGFGRMLLMTAADVAVLDDCKFWLPCCWSKALGVGERESLARKSGDVGGDECRLPDLLPVSDPVEELMVLFQLTLRSVQAARDPVGRVLWRMMRETSLGKSVGLLGLGRNPPSPDSSLSSLEQLRCQ